MPTGSISTGIHDDDKHTGSAKRAVADGVAGLNAAAELEDLDLMMQKYLSIWMVM